MAETTARRNLHALLARVDVAEGRRLSYAEVYEIAARSPWRRRTRHWYNLRASIALKGNVNAAISMAETLHAECDCYLELKVGSNYASASVLQRRGYGQDKLWGFHERSDDNLALAIIAALVKALIQQEAESHD